MSWISWGWGRRGRRASYATLGGTQGRRNGSRECSSIRSTCSGATGRAQRDALRCAGKALEGLVAFRRGSFFRVALVGPFVRIGVTALFVRVLVAFFVAAAFGPFFVPAAAAHTAFDLVGAHALG